MNTDISWRWAATEQAWLHCRYDAYFVDIARNGRFGVNEWKEFLDTYGLKRGKSGKFLRNNFKDVWSVCDEVYSSHLVEGDVDDANRRWTHVIQSLRKRSGVDSPSAAMKIFWLFQPKAVPMFDRFAAIGLRKFERGQRQKRGRMSPQTFLERFEDFFQQSAHHAKAAINATGNAYPYPRRVAEKWLWLNGNPARDEILIRFEVALADFENFSRSG